MPGNDPRAELGGARTPVVRSTLPPAPLSRSARKWVVRWWGGQAGSLGGIMSLVTLPLELGFRAGAGLRGRLYDGGILPLQRAPIPVVSVGNLTVGGSGKTPFSAWLVNELLARGEKAALVARGYGEDEMLLHRRWNPRALIIAQEDRAYGVWKAGRKGATVAVLDDGFQHRRLARSLDIVLVAASTPRRVRLLPRGPFREPPQALRRAGVVVLTQKGQGEDTYAVEELLAPYLREPPVRVRFDPEAWWDLSGVGAAAPDADYLAVAGVGDPEGFSRILGEATGRGGELLTFPDHHDYGWEDVALIRAAARGRTVVTTEKDAVKLEAFKEELGDVRVLSLRVEIQEGNARLWHHLEKALQAGSPGA